MRTTLVEDFIVTSGLEDGHVVLLLESTDFTTYTHALGQYFDYLVVAFVNLVTQFAQTFCALLAFADNQQVEDVIQYIGSYLLGSVTPCTVGLGKSNKKRFAG